MNSGKYAFCAPAALMRASISSTMRSQMAKPVGRITMVPRTGPLSASSALVTRSWYQRGKSSAWGVSTGAFAMTGYYGGTLPGCEFFSPAQLRHKPGPTTPGRAVECGVTWHTGGVRAYVTGATRTGTAATLGGLGR